MFLVAISEYDQILAETEEVCVVWVFTVCLSILMACMNMQMCYLMLKGATVEELISACACRSSGKKILRVCKLLCLILQ